MEHRRTHAAQESRTPDIRRRMRARFGAAQHALKTLAESLRMRGIYLSGLRVMLIGFKELPHESDAEKAAREIAATLERLGARVDVFESSGSSRAEKREDLLEALEETDAALIDTDSSYFRIVRPREMRAQGVEIIVPTTLQA
jgi:hypothetical protein